MTSKFQLDRDVIYGIFKHNLEKDRLDLSDFKLGLVSKKCFLALKTACDEECKAASLWHPFSYPLRVNRDLYFYARIKMSEPVFWLLKELSLCELEFGDDNDQRYLQVLRKIKGDPDSEFVDSDHHSEMLRIISESSGTLKELCYVPDIFLPHLPHTLKLEKLTTARLESIRMNSNIKDCLQLSAKEVRIYADDCYLPSHLLKNINAPTLHVYVKQSWAEGIEESSVEIQANPSIQEISILLDNIFGIPDKIYDIKKIIESIQKGYPNLSLLNIQDIYDMENFFCEGPNKDFFQFFTKLFIKTEALLSELQDLPFSIMMKQVFEARCRHPSVSNYIKNIYETLSLRKDEWKDFEDDPRVKNWKGILLLKKSTQFDSID
uniref:Uncharacterized protein n=1 Tax=Acrobeloides nanus TaxID=290746 RepID=A0A914BV53_9BILA